MFAIFLKSLIIGYSGAVMPGSLLTYTVDRSIRSGARTGFLVSIGHALLELLLVILLLIGADKFLTVDLVRATIGLAGSLVLAYLGFGMIRDAYLNKLMLEISNKNDKNQGNILMAGAVLSATNPYFIIWWSVVGLALIMSSYNSFGLIGVCIFYIGHILADISWFSLVSIIVNKTRHLINCRVYKVIIIGLGLILIFFSITFFVESIKNFYA